MFDDLMVLFSSLVGIPTFIMFVINLLKYFNVVKAGQAQQVSQWLNALVFVGLFVLGMYAPDVDVLGIDKIAAQIADFGIWFLGLVPAGALMSGKLHDAVKGNPLFGKAHS